MRLVPGSPLTGRDRRSLLAMLCVLVVLTVGAAMLLSRRDESAGVRGGPAAESLANNTEAVPLVEQAAATHGPTVPLPEGDQTLGLDDLTLQVTADPFQLRLLGSDGTEIWQTVPSGALRVQGADGVWHAATRLRSAARLGDESTHLEVATDTADEKLLVDVRALAPTLLRLTVQADPPTGVSELAGGMLTTSDEHFVGLGERFTGVEQRGRVVDVWAEDRRVAEYGDSTYAPIPLVLSSRGYSVALENFARSSFDLAASQPDAWTWQQQSSRVSLLLGHGATLKDLIRLHARATGLPPLPPMWAFGTIKAATGGAQQVLADAHRLREHGIPVSAIFAYDTVSDYADIGWPSVSFAGRSAGPYPDPAAYTAALHDLGFKALTYFSPDLHLDRTNYVDAVSDGVLVRDASGTPYVHAGFGISWLDFTNPSTLAWWRERWQRALGELGYDGGMLDLGELLPEGARFADGSTGAETHNAYPMLYARAAWQAAQSARPDGDVVLMGRAGAVGAQRYQSLQWPGDPRMRWDGRDGFQSLLPAGLSFGLSGFPYWHPEVAGYLQSDLGPVRERELWLRWLQFATWSPTLRDHYGEHLNDPTDAWKDAETLGAFRAAARVHAMLIPYLYAAASEAHRDGVPIMRYLPLEFPNDPRAWTQEQSYLLGPDLLVAPVMTPDTRQRTVYLPTGSAWVDFWTGQSYPGGQEVTVKAPLDGGHTPVFARAGAVLPLAPTYDSLVSATAGAITVYSGDLDVRLIPGAGGKTLLGDGTRLSWDGGTSLQVEGSPSMRTIRVTWPGGTTSTAGVSGSALLRP